MEVVIPTIGRTSLRHAVESLANQTIAVNPIVVLDRPSEAQRVQEMLLGFTYKLVITDGGSRAANARNLGLEQVTASVVAFLDDDDWWGPERAARLLGAVPEEVGEFLIASPFTFQLPRGTSRVVPRIAPPFDVPRASLKAGLGNYLVTRNRPKFGRNAMQTSSFVLSTSVARRIRWDPELPKHQDWDFILRVASDESVSFLWTQNSDCYVAKGSSSSISSTMNWRASKQWLERHVSALSVRSRSDFVVVHLLRAALAERSLAGLLHVIRAKPVWPHAAAMVVGIEGIRQGIRRSP